MAIQNASVIKNSVLFRCGELTDGTSSYDSKVLEYMNQIYRSILSGGNEFNLDLGKPWVWARSRAPGTLVLQPKYDTGTITVTNGSTTATLSTPPAVSLVGQWIQINETDDVYRISGNFGVTVTLDAPYTASSGSGLSFSVYFLEYDLSPNIERLIGPMTVDQQQDFNAPMDGLIYGVDIANINENYPMKFIDETVPTNFAQISRSIDGKVRVRFNAQTGSQARVSFDYIPIYSDLIIADCTASGITITSNEHGLRVGQQVSFTVAPTGLAVETVYYVVSSSTNTFSVSTTFNGSAASGLSGSGTVSSIPIMPQSFTQILDYGASFYLMTDKNDERAPQYLQLSAQKMQAMIDANSREMSQTGGIRFAGLIPRLDMFSGPKRYWRQSAN